jgi:hypothetical protein
MELNISNLGGKVNRPRRIPPDKTNDISEGGRIFENYFFEAENFFVFYMANSFTLILTHDIFRKLKGKIIGY